MRRRWNWAVVALAISLLQVSAVAQQQSRKATVHIVIVDGFGRDLGEAKKIDLFKDTDSGKNLADRFHGNIAKDVPYGVYSVSAYTVGFFSGQATAQVFKPDVWVVIGLAPGEEGPMYPAARLQISGTIKNLDLTEEPVYVRLVAVYSDFAMDTRAEASGHSANFTLAGVIYNGKYILVTIGKTKVLDVRQVDVTFPRPAPITIDLGGGQGP